MQNGKQIIAYVQRTGNGLTRRRASPVEIMQIYLTDLYSLTHSWS
jgi:hypothetical protein